MKEPLFARGSGCDCKLTYLVSSWVQKTKLKRLCRGRERGAGAMGGGPTRRARCLQSSMRSSRSCQADRTGTGVRSTKMVGTEWTLPASPILLSLRSTDCEAATGREGGGAPPPCEAACARLATRQRFDPYGAQIGARVGAAARDWSSETPKKLLAWVCARLLCVRVDELGRGRHAPS